MKWRDAALALLTFACAYALKWHYSHAYVETLRWVLLPTSRMVSLVLGSPSVWMSDNGYLFPAYGVVIAKACAGVNFMIVCWVTSSIAFQSRFRTFPAKLGWLTASGVIAYGATLLVNATRIVLSVWFGHRAANELHSSFATVHRMIGVGTYLLALMALCWILQRVLPGDPHRRPLRAVVAVAVGSYLAVTLLVPWLRGAGTHASYAEHATAVMIVVTAIGALLWTATLARRLYHSQLGSALQPKRLNDGRELGQGFAARGMSVE